MQSRSSILVVAFVSGLAFIVIDLTAGGMPFDFALKAMPVWLLGYLVARTVPGLEGRLTSLGLLLGSGGDVALAVGHFVPGLTLFLIGHLFYIVAWTRRFQLQPLRLIPVAIIFVAAIGLAVWLSPSLGGLAIPVYAYVAVISVMSALSFLRSRRSLILPIGTVLFIVSDAIIAINKFHTAVPLAGLWIMLTYYAAQAMIALGFIGEQSED